MLRRALLVIGVLCLVGGVYLLLANGPVAGAGYLIAIGGLLTAGILFERRRYRARVDRERSGWQRTGERFVDPTSGKLMEVRYNPETGERDYVEVEETGPDGLEEKK